LVEDLGLGWYDYGARWYDAAIGRFPTIDRYAEKYYPYSSYGYVANNPIKLVDVNGDSIDVAAVASASPEEWAQTLSELQEFTGLELSIEKSGNMTYKIPEGKLSGSKRARKMLMKAIDHEETVTVVDNEGGGSRVNMDSDDPVEQNTIELDFSELSRFVNGTSGLDSRAYGFGINFFHELGHTRVGGRKLDGGHMVAGPNVQNVNKIRRQLGSNFGQRMVYNQFVVPSDPTNEYHAFSKAALRSLVAGEVPTGGYVKVPR
jgi:RHS repeat-associated protein